MEFEKILQKRLRGMAVRILANIEHTIGADLGDMGDDEQFMLRGCDLNIIRSEVLNAAGDTTRSLAQLVGSAKPSKSNGLSFSRDMIRALNSATLDIVDDGEEPVPVFRASGDFNLLSKIRNEVGAGVVYKKTYTCAGVDEVINSLMPYLDVAQMASIKIADGEYREWRDAVCELYLEGLGNE